MKTYRRLRSICKKKFTYKEGHLYYCDTYGNVKKAESKHNRLSVGGRKYNTAKIIYLMHFGHLPEKLCPLNKNWHDHRIENLFCGDEILRVGILNHVDHDILQREVYRLPTINIKKSSNRKIYHALTYINGFKQRSAFRGWQEALNHLHHLKQIAENPNGTPLWL